MSLFQDEKSLPKDFGQPDRGSSLPRKYTLLVYFFIPVNFQIIVDGFPAVIANKNRTHLYCVEYFITESLWKNLCFLHLGLYVVLEVKSISYLVH